MRSIASAFVVLLVSGISWANTLNYKVTEIRVVHPDATDNYNVNAKITKHVGPDRPGDSICSVHLAEVKPGDPYDTKCFSVIMLLSLIDEGKYQLEFTPPQTMKITLQGNIEEAESIAESKTVLVQNFEGNEEIKHNKKKKGPQASQSEGNPQTITINSDEDFSIDLLENSMMFDGRGNKIKFLKY